MALAFSVKDTELPEAVCRLMQEASESRRQLQHLNDELLQAEAARLAGEAEACDAGRIVVCAFEDRDPRQVCKLASLVAAEPRTVALIGLSGAKARLFFTRSDDLAIDVAMLLKETCREFGGGGGGQANVAQGGGFAGQDVQYALDWARRKLISS